MDPANLLLEALQQSPVLRAVSASTVGVFWVVVLTRVVGLRTFSKMTSFDFVVTVAAGSLLANAAAASEWSSFVQSMVAIAAMFGVQVVLALGRERSKGLRAILDNRPLLLARDGTIDESALRRARVARADVLAKMREANALDLDSVQAVVLEATGDISVLHGNHPVQDEVMDNVRS